MFMDELQKQIEELDRINAEDNSLRSLNKEFKNINIPNERLNNKRYIIKCAEENGIDCRIFKKKLSHKIEQFYLDLLKEGKNIGLFARQNAKLSELKLLASEIFDSDKYKDDDFKYSNPYAVSNFIIYSRMIGEDFGEYNKCFMNMNYPLAIPIIIENKNLVFKYLKSLLPSRFCDFYYLCLIDSLLNCTNEEKEEIIDVLTSDKYDIQMKETYAVKFLKPTRKGLKNLLEILKFYVDNIVLIGPDSHKIGMLATYRIIPFIPPALFELMRNDDEFLRGEIIDN